jgi:hypothetical protein
VAKDKAKAILSYATPNPVGPYRLVTPPTPAGPSQTKTPVLPVVGGSLVNVPLPQMPSRTSNAPAQDVGQRKQINVPTLPMAEKLKSESADKIAQTVKESKPLGSMYDSFTPSKTPIAQTIREVRGYYQQRLSEVEANGVAIGYTRDHNRRLALATVDGEIRNLVKLPLTDQQRQIAYRGLAESGLLQGRSAYYEKRPRLTGAKMRPGFANTRIESDYPVNDREFYDKLATSLTGMSTPQIETFFALLPEWEGTLTELATTARSLGG